jgi:hypothetical protein
VNEEIIEDLLQRMEQSSKKCLRKLLLQADIPTLQERRPGDSERRLEYCNWFLNNLNDDRFLIMNLIKQLNFLTLLADY